MSKPKLRCTPVSQSTACGAALFVETQLDSGATDPLSLIEGGYGSPFSYRLEPKAVGQATLHLSAKGYAQRKFPSMGKPAANIPRVVPPAGKKAVPPSGKYHRKEEIAHYLAGNIPAGDYALIACLEADGDTIYSEPVDIRIEPFRVRGSASTYCGHRLSFAAVVAHESADSGTSIYQFESLGEDALDGVWYPRNTSLSEVPTSMAVSSHVGNRGEGRWFAWTTATSLGAQKGHGKVATIVVSSLALNSPTVVLLDGSFDHADGSATFFAIDQSRESLIRVHADADGLQFADVDAPWFGVPRGVIVTYDLRAESPVVHFTWAEKSGPDTLVWQSSSRAEDMTAVNAPLLISQRPEDLLALTTPRVIRPGGRDRRDLHMLWGAAADGLMTCGLHREGKSPPHPEETRFAAPDASMSQWALTHERESSFIVAASDGSQLLLRSVAGTWEVSIAGCSIEELTLLTADGTRIWAQWFDRSSGYEASDTSPPKAMEP